MALTPREHKELIKLQKETAAIQDKINSGVKVQERTLRKQEQHLQKIIKLEEKR